MDTSTATPHAEPFPSGMKSVALRFLILTLHPFIQTFGGVCFSLKIITHLLGEGGMSFNA